MLDLNEYLSEKIMPIPESGCWIWMTSTDRDGYCQVKRDGKNTMAHRLVYEHLVGEIPKGMTLDHLCRVRCCVNPHHLEPVTQRENTLRGNTVPAIHAAKTHCIRGHEFSPVNTYMWRGWRICRECRRLKNRHQNKEH